MNKRLIWILVIFIVIYFVLQIISSFFLDYRWFLINNNTDIFWTLLLTKFNVQGIFSLFFIALFCFNFLLMYLLGGRGRIFTRNIMDKIRLPLQMSTRRFLLIILAAGVVIVGSIMGLSASVYWQEYLKFSNAVPFTGFPKDPIFSLDIGFYVFSLPFYQFLYAWLMTALAIITVFSTVFHVLNGGICIQENRLDFSLFSRAHLSILLALIVFLLGIGYRLNAYELLFSGSGKFFGAGYTADNAERIMYNICTIISFAGAALLLFNIFKRSFKLPIIVLATLFPAYFILGTIYPSIQQRFFVVPDEMDMERPYIENNIRFTRLAYGIDRVKEMDFANNTKLTYRDLAKNSNIIENIRLWDWRPLKQTYKQKQTLRPYYQFNDVDVDRYEINGNRVAVNIAARELSIDGLSPESSTWINKHLVYTHGYGAVLSRVDKTTPEGLPEMLIHDLPLRMEIPLDINRPQIYYGEHNNPYIITNTNTASGEMDYPSDSYYVYDGTGGDRLDSFLKKFLYAVALNDINILISSNIRDESRILFRRNIIDMVHSLTPFLEFDDDPYLVIADGRLFWLIDAYTTSDKFPYSTPVSTPGGEINYIRNSVKILIDAYNGRMDYYISDPVDPIIKTYANIFIGLFKNISELPDYIRPHVRYPEFIFNIQTRIMLRYHMKDPGIFYKNEDRWEIPKQKYEEGEEDIHSYYLVTTLPGETAGGFILIMPFTMIPKDKMPGNMSAFLIARCDPENYGEMILYNLPKGKQNYSPLLVETSIETDAEISKQLSLWNKGGTSTMRGNMVIIPVEESLLYVESLYLKAQTSEMPALKRVIVFFADRVVMERDLATALERLFSGDFPAGDSILIEDTDKPGIRELADRAYMYYLQAETNLKNGDWTKYGESLNNLKEILAKMKDLK